MVRRSSELATEQLRFFERIGEAADWLGTVDLIHSNGAIQYVPDTLETVRALSRFGRLRWHGTAFRLATRLGERFRHRT